MRFFKNVRIVNLAPYPDTNFITNFSSVRMAPYNLLKEWTRFALICLGKK
jgi:hypothetical protein